MINIVVAYCLVMAWISYAWFARHKNIRGLMQLYGHWYVGILSCTFALGGVVIISWMIEYATLETLSNCVLFWISSLIHAIGIGVFAGWAISPGGQVYLWTPIFALTGYWPSRYRESPIEQTKMWSRLSTIMAIAFFLIRTYALISVWMLMSL